MATKISFLQNIEKLFDNDELSEDLERETPHLIDGVPDCEYDNIFEDTIPQDVSRHLEVHSSELEDNQTSKKKSCP